MKENQNKKSNKKQILIIAAVLAVLIAAFAIIYAVFGPKAVAGAKEVTISVIDDKGAQTDYDVHTDAEYLAEVFDEIDGLTVEGTAGDYGLYINTVNGVTADYEKDGAYWSIYVNDEYGQYGADTQPVADGDSFKLAYEVYQAQ